MNQEKVWDEIADQWYHFRQQKFQPVYDFMDRYHIEKGKILEIGCGNARNLIPFAKRGLECYGIDFSNEMIKQANKLAKKYNIKITLKKTKMTHLPFRDNYFDYVLHTSSLHHLRFEGDIIKALKEAKRVVKSQGLILLTVWNKLQLKFLFRPRDLYIPWYKRGEEYLRFYHLFDYFELKKLIKEANLKTLESNLLGKNLIFILKNE